MILAKYVYNLISWSKRTLLNSTKYLMINIDPTVSFGVSSVLIGNRSNLIIFAHSCINQAHLEIDELNDGSKIRIGSGCVIGYRVNVKASMPSINKPTNNQDKNNI